MVGRPGRHPRPVRRGVQAFRPQTVKVDCIVPLAVDVPRVEFLQCKLHTTLKTKRTKLKLQTFLRFYKMKINTDTQLIENILNSRIFQRAVFVTLVAISNRGRGGLTRLRRSAPDVDDWEQMCRRMTLVDNSDSGTERQKVSLNVGSLRLDSACVMCR